MERSPSPGEKARRRREERERDSLERSGSEGEGDGRRGGAFGGGREGEEVGTRGGWGRGGGGLEGDASRDAGGGYYGGSGVYGGYGGAYGGGGAGGAAGGDVDMAAADASLGGYGDASAADAAAGGGPSVLPPMPPLPPPPPPPIDPEAEMRMMQMMGIPMDFNTTKGKEVKGANQLSAVKLSTKRQPRQYMNRRGFLPRALAEWTLRFPHSNVAVPAFPRAQFLPVCALSGTTERPRLAVFRSNNHIYAQVVDDTKQHTLAAASTLTPALREELKLTSGPTVEASRRVGQEIAKICLERGISKVAFDRGGFVYHGRIQALADGARTIFAYGQTSSGKTFTMRGVPACEGVIPLSVRQVFDTISQTMNREFLLRVSYLEIYNEEINDLLAPDNRRLQIHESSERGVFVAGLHEEIVMCPDQVLQLLSVGETNRSIGETKMNEKSSRSHAIFRMVLESREIPEEGATEAESPVLVSSLVSATRGVVSATRGVVSATRGVVSATRGVNLVDLAGSERVAKTGAEGSRLKEGAHINKSLMTLGTVINKLSEGADRNGAHIPYRDSKLTRILQPALGGNTKTAIICCATPALRHEDETHGTLRFALRAKCITNCAKVNEIVTNNVLLKRQAKEIEDLRRKLEASHSPEMEQEIMKLRNAMLKMESEKEVIALQLQEERAAHSQKEQRIKEQERKIENLSTLVIKAAAGDRQNDRRPKKGNRRESWCPNARVESSPARIKVTIVCLASLLCSRWHLLNALLHCSPLAWRVPLQENQPGGIKRLAFMRRAMAFKEDDEEEEDEKEEKDEKDEKPVKVQEVNGAARKRRISSVQKLAALWETSGPKEVKNEEEESEGFQDGQVFQNEGRFGSGVAQDESARDGSKKRRAAPFFGAKEENSSEVSSPVAKKLAEKDALIAQLQAQVAAMQVNAGGGGGGTGRSAEGGVSVANSEVGAGPGAETGREAGEGGDEKDQEASGAGSGQERRSKSMGTPAVLAHGLQAKVAALEMEKACMQRELDYLQEELEDCKRQLEEAQAAAKADTPRCDNCSALKEALESANSQLYETEHLLQEATAEAAQARCGPAGAAGQLLEKQRELEAAVWEASQLKRRVEELEANVIAVEGVLLEVSGEKDSLEEEVGRLKSLLTEGRAGAGGDDAAGKECDVRGVEEMERLREVVEQRERELTSLHDAVRRLQADVAQALGDPAPAPALDTVNHGSSMEPGAGAGKAVVGEMRDLCAAVGRVISSLAAARSKSEDLSLQLKQVRERETEGERKLAEAQAAAAESARKLAHAQLERKGGEEEAAVVSRLQAELEEAGRELERAVAARDTVELNLLTARREADARAAESARQMGVFEEKIRVLEGEVEREREERRTWEERAEEREGEVRRAAGEKREAEERLEGVRREVEEMSARVGEKERELAAVQEELKLVLKEKDSASQRADQVAADLEAARASATEAQLQLEVCKQQHAEELAEARKELLATKKEMSSLKGKPGAAERERDQLRKEAEKRKTKMLDLEAKLKAVQAEKLNLQVDKATLEREVKSLRNQSNQLARDLSKREQVEDKRREVQAKAVQADRQLAAMASEIEEKYRAIVDLQEALEGAEGERDELRLRVAAAAEESEQLQAEVDAGQADLQEVLADFETATTQIKALQEIRQELVRAYGGRWWLQKVQQEPVSRSTLLTVSFLDCAQTEQVEELERGKAEAEAAGKEAEGKIVALQARIQLAEEEKRQLEADIAAARKEHSELAAQHKEAVQDLEKEKARVANLEGDLRAERAKSERLGKQADEVVAMESKLNAANERIAGLQRQVQEREEQVEHLKQERKEAEEEARAEGEGAALAVKRELASLQNKYSAQKSVWRKAFAEKKERVENLTLAEAEKQRDELLNNLLAEAVNQRDELQQVLDSKEETWEERDEKEKQRD
ncbi:unnamed protein product [Closterium sp. NIES-65]|nr:unnamed protein product [Closterium sp. NIES-65]